MNRAGHDLYTDPTLAEEEDRRVQPCEARDGRPDQNHLWRPADERHVSVV